MSIREIELSVNETRDRFSDAVNRAAFGGEITYVTRGRGHHHAAAIVPAELVERYEEMIDREDGRVAAERLRGALAFMNAPKPATPSPRCTARTPPT
jgi:hypothetical protein